jgi:hypothetical protein
MASGVAIVQRPAVEPAFVGAVVLVLGAVGFCGAAAGFFVVAVRGGGAA